MKPIQCPNCQKTIEWSAKYPYRPFCSDRCRLIDLGSWADGSYAIPSQSPPDEFAGDLDDLDN